MYHFDDQLITFFDKKDVESDLGKICLKLLKMLLKL